jgi:hypothetical protein
VEDFCRRTLLRPNPGEKLLLQRGGQYFEVKIEYSDITPAEFQAKMGDFTQNLDSLFAESARLEGEIRKQLGGLKYEQ